MKLAIKAHIDAFALNIAKDEDTNESSLGNVFLAAQNVGFYLFFSFDYAAEPGVRTKLSAISRITHRLPVTGTTILNLWFPPSRAPIARVTGSILRHKQIASLFQIGRPSGLRMPWP